MTDKEKLEKIKQLADAMYNRMQNLTTDTSGIRKAMDDYHQFIIFQYHKEDTVSEDLEEAAKNVGQKYFPNEYNIWARPNYEAVKAECAFKDGANWQKEQMMAKAEEFIYYALNDGIMGTANIEDFMRLFKKYMEG